MKILSIFIFLMSYFVSSNSFAGYKEDISAINKGMPQSVKLFNQRQIECNHWGGEEPYDKSRQKEIMAAIIKLKCDALNKDEKELLIKYKFKQKVIDSIYNAKAYS